MHFENRFQLYILKTSQDWSMPSEAVERSGPNRTKRRDSHTMGDDSTEDAGGPQSEIDDDFVQRLGELSFAPATAPETYGSIPLRRPDPGGQRAERRYCEQCRGEIAPGLPGTVTALQQISGRGGSTFDGLPRLFHEECWAADHCECRRVAAIW
jgi:hypothetical protein